MLYLPVSFFRYVSLGGRHMHGPLKCCVFSEYQQLQVLERGRVESTAMEHTQ